MQHLRTSPDVTEYVQLQIPPRYSYLRIVRQSVRDMCVQAGISEFKAAQLEMAVDEACSQIIEHLSRARPAEGGSQLSLDILLSLFRNRVEVELRHPGDPLDISGEQEVPPEEFARHPADKAGLAVYVIRRFVDDVQYGPDESGLHCLRLMKKI